MSNDDLGRHGRIWCSNPFRGPSSQQNNMAQQGQFGSLPMESYVAPSKPAYQPGQANAIQPQSQGSAYGQSPAPSNTAFANAWNMQMPGNRPGNMQAQSFGGGGLGNLAYMPDSHRPPPFSSYSVGPDGRQMSQQDSLAQRDQFIGAVLQDNAQAAGRSGVQEGREQYQQAPPTGGGGMPFPPQLQQYAPPPMYQQAPPMWANNQNGPLGQPQNMRADGNFPNAQAQQATAPQPDPYDQWLSSLPGFRTRDQWSSQQSAPAAQPAAMAPPPPAASAPPPPAPGQAQSIPPQSQGTPYTPPAAQQPPAASKEEEGRIRYQQQLIGRMFNEDYQKRREEQVNNGQPLRDQYVKLKNGEVVRIPNLSGDQSPEETAYATQLLDKLGRMALTPGGSVYEYVDKPLTPQEQAKRDLYNKIKNPGAIPWPKTKEEMATYEQRLADQEDEVWDAKRQYAELNGQPFSDPKPSVAKAEKAAREKADGEERAKIREIDRVNKNTDQFTRELLATAGRSHDWSSGRIDDIEGAIDNAIAALPPDQRAVAEQWRELSYSNASDYEWRGAMKKFRSLQSRASAAAAPVAAPPPRPAAPPRPRQPWRATKSR